MKEEISLNINSKCLITEKFHYSRVNNRRRLQLRGKPDIRCCKKKWRHIPEPTRRTNENGNEKNKPAMYFIKYMATEPGHTPEKPLK